jgi:hypothetical protein
MNNKRKMKKKKSCILPFSTTTTKKSGNLKCFSRFPDQTSLDLFPWFYFVCLFIYLRQGLATWPRLTSNWPSSCLSHLNCCDYRHVPPHPASLPLLPFHLDKQKHHHGKAPTFKELSPTWLILNVEEKL